MRGLCHHNGHSPYFFYNPEYMTKIKEIAGKRSPILVERLTAVWERSVRTTHTFLSEEDIAQIRPCVGTALREVSHLIILGHDESPAGFMGIEGNKIEMLFLAPEYIGLGLGGKLTDIALRDYGTTQVDVNEQNAAALGFYLHKGFHTVSRDALDDQGRPFPILHLKHGQFTLDLSPGK